MSNVMTLPKNPNCPLGAVIIQLPVRNWWPQSQEIQATSRMRGHSFAKHSSPTIPIRMMKLYVYVGYETTVYCVLISELMIKDFPIFQKFFHAHNNYNNNNNINCIAFKCLKKKVVCLRLIEDFRCVTQIQLLPLWHDTCGTWCGVSAWHSLLLSSTHNFLFSTTLLSFSLKKSQRNRVRITLYSPTKAFFYIVRTDEIILVWYLLKGLLALHWQCRNFKRNI